MDAFEDAANEIDGIVIDNSDVRAGAPLLIALTSLRWHSTLNVTMQRTRRDCRRTRLISPVWAVAFAAASIRSLFRASLAAAAQVADTIGKGWSGRIW
jgi:hypothetical protein